MRRILLFIAPFAASLLTFLVIGVAIYIWGNFTESGQIDACLDRGGRWNQLLKECEGPPP